jgi:hypothetical protein
MAHHAGLYRRRQYFYFKFKDDNGKWIERATRTTDRKKALSIKSEFLREFEAGQLPNDRSRWTLRETADSWLLDRKLRVAHSSYLSKKTIVRALERHFANDTKLAKLANMQSIKQYQTARLGEGLSPKTVTSDTEDTDETSVLSEAPAHAVTVTEELGILSLMGLSSKTVPPQYRGEPPTGVVP